jgi:hypothetical protein
MSNNNNNNNREIVHPVALKAINISIQCLSTNTLAELLFVFNL